jgi:hypothetical protein
VNDALQVLDSLDRALDRRLALDWLLLLAQIAILLAVAAAEIRRTGRRNLVVILVVATLLLLVQGQAWWVFTKLETSSSMQQLYQLITEGGARLANLYLTLAMAAFAAVYLVTRRRRQAAESGQDQADGQVHAPARQATPYVLVGCWTLASAGLLLATLGGPSDLLGQLGRMAAGQAGALMALGLGKFPLYDAVASGRRPGPYALALFAVVFVATLFSSRFLALFLLVQLAVIWNYRRTELPRGWLLGLAAGGAAILVGFGLFRDLIAIFPSGTPLDGLTVAQFRTQRTSEGLGDWFFGLNVEGFTGLAGILTFTQLNGGLGHDFGLSSLRFATQLLPNAWRTDPSLPFMGVSQSLEQAYPYHGSVVAPGFELAYGHFGLLGVVSLGGLLGYLSSRVHQAMRSTRVDPLLVGLLSVQLLQLVRGTFVTVLVFGLADVIGLRLYRAMAAIETGAAVPAPHKSPSPLRGGAGRGPW